MFENGLHVKFGRFLHTNRRVQEVLTVRETRGTLEVVPLWHRIDRFDIYSKVGFYEKFRFNQKHCRIFFLYFTWKSIWLEGSFSESGDWFSSESGEFESSEGSAAIEGLLKNKINTLITIRIQIGVIVGI